ncbi:MAG: hypothetical protein A2342_02330 [Gallionellales bacterium RIFOXYB12_FULL_54_9]|nr:MAG: hypothetical protein A2342_02330 [Gallionellales bacterium RIFOXYB12_FULL_54_9]
MFYVSSQVPLVTNVQSLSAELAESKAHPGLNADSLSQLPEKQLTTFHQTFLNVKAAPDVLETLHEAAVVQGVTLEQGEYHLLRNGPDKLARYQIVLPIKGDYLHLRKFLSQILTDMHYASIDSIEFQRQKASDTLLDAQVKMTVFLNEN